MNNNCQYFVKRKKRFCRMTVKTGHKYCGEHEQNNENLEEKRIPCPLDNKHTCFASKLTKHLKVCNAKIDVLPPYIKKNFNAEKIEETSGNYVEQTSERFLSKAPIEDVKNVLTKISQAYNAVIKGKINEKILDYELLTNEILNPEFGFTTKKHLTQTSSILGHLQNAELLKPNTSFIEFGAGKGKLSFWLAKSTENISDTSIVLVDKASHRHKMDNKLKIDNCSAQERIHRIRGDILDLDLSQIDVIRKSKHVIGLTKHLCGVATDYAMRCLENLHKDCNNVTGILMSFCCHHRCLWRDYVGKQFLLKNDFSPQEFDIMCGVVSWATSGVGMSKEKRKELEELSQKSLSSTTVEFDRNKELGLSRDEKTEYGKMAKLLLDYGRMEFLKSLGFNCYLYYYVKPEISLENVLIVATK